jgi:hypothetical protein
MLYEVLIMMIESGYSDETDVPWMHRIEGCPRAAFNSSDTTPKRCVTDTPTQRTACRWLSTRVREEHFHHAR